MKATAARAARALALLASLTTASCWSEPAAPDVPQELGRAADDTLVLLGCPNGSCDGRRPC